MSEWTPKVGDRVMVGEHGPYSLVWVHSSDGYCQIREVIGSNDPKFFAQVPLDWLTPAPDPEPDEPTAPGALVRDGHGELWCFNPRKARGPFPDWDLVGQDISRDWTRIPRPVTVVLADPAEVETLREKVDEGKRVIEEMAGAWHQVKTLRAERDELQRRIDAVLAKEDSWGGMLYHAITQILRGER